MGSRVMKSCQPPPWPGSWWVTADRPQTSCRPLASATHLTSVTKTKPGYLICVSPALHLLRAVVAEPACGEVRGREPVGEEAKRVKRRQLLLHRHVQPGALRQALLPHPTGGPPLSPSTASHSQVDSDMAVCEDLWELLEDADGEWLVFRPELPTSRALKCC